MTKIEKRINELERSIRAQEEVLVFMLLLFLVSMAVFAIL